MRRVDLVALERSVKRLSDKALVNTISYYQNNRKLIASDCEAALKIITTEIKWREYENSKRAQAQGEG